MVFITTHSDEVGYAAEENSLSRPHVALTLDDNKVHYISNEAIVQTVNITFPKEGCSTYYNGEYDVVLPFGMKAYVIVETQTGCKYLEISNGDSSRNVIPAGTAVLLQIHESTAAQTLTVSLVEPRATSYTGSNLLHGSDVATTTTGGAKYYKLTYSNNNDNFGWYWGAPNGDAFTSPAHKVWLAFPTDTSSTHIDLPD